MLYREIIAVCSQIHTKHINTLCGQNVELFNVKPLGFKELILFCAVTAKKYECLYVLLTCSARNDASRRMSDATPLGSQSTALLRRVGINSEKKKL